MTILHITDFHFNQRWFDWLLHRAPAHDLVTMSGDLLDLSAVTPHGRQIEWVTDWLNDFPRPLVVASGNHDLEWNSDLNRWTPAYWLRAIENPNVWTDGQRVALNGLSLLPIGATTRPRGGDAHVWVTHAPPSSTLVATRPDGTDGGDRDLVPALHRHSPLLVLSGHVHSPMHWRQLRRGTLFLNPGCDPAASFPNHILLDTDEMRSEFVSAARGVVRNVALPGLIESESEQTAQALA